MDRDIFFFSRFLVHFQYAVIEMTLRPSNSSKQWRRDYVQSMLDATRFIYIVVGPCWGYTAMVNVWWGRANTKKKRERDEKPIAIKLCIDAVEWNLFVHFLPFFFFISFYFYARRCDGNTQHSKHTSCWIGDGFRIYGLIYGIGGNWSGRPTLHATILIDNICCDTNFRDVWRWA